MSTYNDMSPGERRLMSVLATGRAPGMLEHCAAGFTDALSPPLSQSLHATSQHARACARVGAARDIWALQFPLRDCPNFKTDHEGFMRWDGSRTRAAAAAASAADAMEVQRQLNFAAAAASQL
jgi:hypothetical protein